MNDPQTRVDNKHFQLNYEYLPSQEFSQQEVAEQAHDHHNKRHRDNESLLVSEKLANGISEKSRQCWGKLHSWG